MSACARHGHRATALPPAVHCVSLTSRLVRAVTLLTFILFLKSPGLALAADQTQQRTANLDIGMEAIGQHQREAYEALLELQNQLGDTAKATPLTPSGDGKTFEITVDAPDNTAPAIEPATKPPQTQSSGGARTASATQAQKAPDQGKQLRLEEAQLYYRTADFHMKRAVEAREKALEAQDPAMRHYHLRVAEENKSWAESAMRKFGHAMETDPVPNAQVIQSSFSFQKKKAWQQLLDISGGAPKAGKQLDLFDTAQPLPAPPPPGSLKPRVQDLLQNHQSKGSEEVIEFGDGLQIDIAPLRQAIAEVDGADAGKPLFKVCGDVQCPTRTLLKYFSTDELRGKLKKIGGVALDVTVDMLGGAGIPEFRAGADLTLVDQPNLVSLKNLAEAVRPYAEGDNWASLPDDLRYPGNLERVHGFVLDPVSEDIFLLGTPARAPHRRLDIDHLILAIRKTWKEGKQMSVSLDPDPGFLSGPRRPRFANLPGDSITAKTMIEADMVMKHMLIAWGPYADQRFMPLSEIAERFKDETPTGGRFWLNPKRLARDAMYVSVTGRTILFETRIQALTEEAFLSNGRWQYTGETSGFREAQIDAFTERYALYEETDDIKPAGVFKRLHGIVDLVTLAKLWRINALDYPVLNDIAALPYRKLSGQEALPEVLPDTYSWYLVGGQIREVFGGAVLDVGLSAASLYENEDPRIADLERLVDGFRSDAVVSHDTTLLIGLPRETDDAARSIKPLLLAGERAWRDGDFDRAHEVILKARDLDPSSPETWAWLARTEEQRGDLTASLAAIREAVRFAPWDKSYFLQAMDLLWRVDPDAVIARLDPEDREELASHYTEQVARHLRDRDFPLALDVAEKAIRLDPDDPRPYLHKAVAYDFSGETTAALAEYNNAFARDAALVHVFLKSALSQNKRALKRISGHDKALEKEPGNTSHLVGRAFQYAAVGLPALAVADLTQTIALRPQGPLLARAYTERGHLYTQMKLLDLALADFNDALALLDGVADAYYGRARVRHANRDYDLGLKDIERALDLEPDIAEFMELKACLEFAVGERWKAFRDFNFARRLSPNRPLSEAMMTHLKGPDVPVYAGSLCDGTLKR